MTILKPPSQLDCRWLEECIEICDGPSVYVEELGVRATFRNPDRKQIRKIQYDGCFNKTLSVSQADYIVGETGKLDVIVELKSSDTNIKEAARQVDHTLHAWRQSSIAYPKIAGLIIYGRIEAKKKRAGRVPRANSMIETAERDFLRTNKVLLLIREHGSVQFKFSDFLRKSDAR